MGERAKRDREPPSRQARREHQRFRFTLEESVKGFTLTHDYWSEAAVRHNRAESALAGSCMDGQCVFHFEEQEKEENFFYPCERLMRAPRCSPFPAGIDAHPDLDAYLTSHGVCIVSHSDAYGPKLTCIDEALKQARVCMTDPDKPWCAFTEDELVVRVRERDFIPHYRPAIARLLPELPVKFEIQGV